jgi:hypothetical protein
MKVTSLPSTSAACDGILAGATAFLVDKTTLRPIYGLILLCEVNVDQLNENLATTVHEILHALACPPSLDVIELLIVVLQGVTMQLHECRV